MTGCPLRGRFPAAASGTGRCSPHRSYLTTPRVVGFRMLKKRAKRKPGPRPEPVKIDGDRQQAMRKALGKEKPPGGWPKPDGH